MKDYFLQLLFTTLGATLPILFRALYHAGNEFDIWFFFTNNRIRFYILVAAMLIMQSLLFFEGDGIIESLKAFGVIAPIGASSVIGFGLAWLVVKTIPTNDK